MLTSLACFQHGITDWTSVLPDTFVILPEILAEGGYATACVINMVGMDGRFGILRGFQHQSVTGKYDRNATATTDEVVELIRTLPRPFFILVHYFDTQHPYNPPAEFIDVVNDTSTQNLQSLRSIPLYDACIRYVDTQIGRIIKALHKNAIYANTLITITADHGEAFGEHGRTGHGRTLYDEEVKVPLILHLPSRFATWAVIRQQVRLMDLAPTLVEIAGLKSPQSWEGVSFATSLEPKANPSQLIQVSYHPMSQ